MKQIPELLSPAGNFDSLKMAVYAGATAVYFGAKNFNARAKAENFGEDMQTAVAFCHKYGVKVYLTLNTLIEEEQITELLETIKNSLAVGVDAFIVQDLGVASLIKNCFPTAHIHASTQMAINNYEGALFAKNLGFERVVLARETSLEDIKLIKEKTGLEIEYFIQGALCVCLSGNCYLSSSLFGKSGNKGECMQPCRLPYKAFLKNKEIASGFLLSAKDINMSNRLKDLINAGVDSFKIEGRLRRPAYVYRTTNTYRQIIDNNYVSTNNNQTVLKKAFNRGDFCEGYFNGNGLIIDDKIQGHKGIKIGRVISFKKGNKFNIVTVNCKNINKGDVLKFIHNGYENATITAIDIKKNNDHHSITTTAEIKQNSEVYLILDKEYEDSLLQNVKKLPLNITMIAMADNKLKLEYELIYGINSIEKKLFGSIEGLTLEKAQNMPATYNSVYSSMQKFGGTDYQLNKFTLETNGVFIPKKELNELRRNLVEKLDNNFTQNNNIIYNDNYLKKSQKYIEKNNKKYTLEIGEKYSSNADFFVIKPRDFINFDYSKITHKNAFLYIPSFLPNIDLQIIKSILNNNQNLGVYAQNIGALNLSNKIILGAKLNLKNEYAIRSIISNKVVLIEASPELSNENYELLKQKFNVPFVKADFNNFELMTLIHCPIKNIYKNNCGNCKYSCGIVYEMQNKTKLFLDRYKIKNCFFTLSKNISD